MMMNRNAITFLILALFLIAGIFVFFLKGENPLSGNGDFKGAAENLSGQTEDEKVKEGTSRSYIEFFEGALEENSDKRRVLFFYANWCPTCRPVDADLKANTSKIPEDVVVIRVNYNDPETDGSERQLANKYNITYQHTFVEIDSEGREIQKWNGGDMENLLGKIKEK